MTIHGVRPGYHRLALRRLGVPNSSDVFAICLNARVESYGPNGLAPFVCMDILDNGEIFQVEGQSLEWSGGAAGYDVPRAQIVSALGEPRSSRRLVPSGCSEDYYPQWCLAIRYEVARLRRTWMHPGLARRVPTKEAYLLKPLSEWFGTPVRLEDVDPPPPRPTPKR